MYIYICMHTHTHFNMPHNIYLKKTHTHKDTNIYTHKYKCINISTETYKSSHTYIHPQRILHIPHTHTYIYGKAYSHIILVQIEARKEKKKAKTNSEAF